MLPRILTELRDFDGPILDRQAVQRLFGIGERRARQLMAGLPGLRVGNALAVGRIAFIGRLEKIAQGATFEREVSRRARIAETLEALRRHARAQAVRLGVATDAHTQELPEGVKVTVGELRIHFSGAGDLAAKLFELSQAMANDWEAFRRAAEEPGHKLQVQQESANFRTR